MTQKDLEWYQKKNGIIIVLILFFPVGLYLMWKHSDWSKKTKLIITTIFFIALIVPKGEQNTSFQNTNSSTKVYGNSSCGYCSKSYKTKDGWSSVMRVIQPSSQGRYCSRKCATEFLKSL